MAPSEWQSRTFRQFCATGRVESSLFPCCLRIRSSQFMEVPAKPEPGRTQPNRNCRNNVSELGIKKPFWITFQFGPIHPGARCHSTPRFL